MSTHLFVVDTQLLSGSIANIRRRFITTRGCDFVAGGTVCMLMALGGSLSVVVVVVVKDSG